MNFNPYLVFDVPMSADFELLRATYRRLAREHHPDIATDKPRATEKMAQINRAWGILGDQDRRAQFDLEWRRHQSEQARQELLRRDAMQREIDRARRTPTVSKPKTAPRTAKSTSKGATPSKSPSKATLGKAKRGLSAHLKAKISQGEAPRAASASQSAARPRNYAATVDFGDSDSPRALRLMRKITLASRVWHRDGNGKVAIEMCRAVLLADGRNVPARELLGEIFAAQGRL